MAPPVPPAPMRTTRPSAAFAAPLPLRRSAAAARPAALQRAARVKPPPRATQAPPVIVPGKFDALHLGHRHLAQTASHHGSPTLLSFSGMAAKLRWPPRAPITAPSDRARILRSWQSALATPIHTVVLPFHAVGDMPPDAFVRFLKARFDAHAVVCGADWRFGKGAVGDVGVLKQSAATLGMHVHVASTVALHGQGVSSTRVRNALSEGDVALVAALLGRYHRAVGCVVHVDAHGAVRCAGFVNQLPRAGLYEAVVRVVGRTAPTRGTVQVGRDGDGEAFVLLFDSDAVYCAECELYVDFVDRLV
ncbi:FAD synthetase 1, chloroplastic [Gracilariopsis chorda]|uniref:FAD synthase n=1 Tax=Gracilariopsis chorda TaxID=448386 RepID=A0A2V3IHH9_9FLOR|nr:FAD synthetase 1, chloroplastic [Gracilariopsis chorda]|eukprot:PXF41488.1 FAD synthetase 1, chloroplastic [Gracilariopsis chorda]